MCCNVKRKYNEERWDNIRRLSIKEYKERD